MRYSEKYKVSLEYIENYWSKIIFKPSKVRLRYSYINFTPKIFGEKNDDPHSIHIPNSYIVPNTGHFRRLYYWDSFFMFKGLLGTKRQWIMVEMVENFMHFFNKYQIIPNFSAPASINRSQPPLLTSMILDTYINTTSVKARSKTGNAVLSQVKKLNSKQWLKKAINVAKKEYELVWIDKEGFYNHSVPDYDLSRYGDRDIGYAHSSELESGWDMTSRFYNRCDQFLPIDLNSFLYKYETDFAYVAKILGNGDEYKSWNEKAKKRKNEINKHMWNNDEKFFFDYGYAFKQPSHFFSLASYTPMWAGLATEYQAKYLVERLPMFETHYGLTICAKESLARPIDLSKIQRRFHPALDEIIKPKQWDYPNIWSPLEYLTVIGLLKYGYIKDAKRIMENSLKAHNDLYKKHKTFFEKIDGVTGGGGSGALYGDQKGFGWTNAVFYRYVQILDAIDSLPSIYSNSKLQTPPYALSILH